MQSSKWLHCNWARIIKWWSWIVRMICLYATNVIMRNGRLVWRLIHNNIQNRLINRDTSLTIYVDPESVPASQGYKSTTLFSIHEQFGRHNSRPATPKNQSGDGSIIETNETKWWLGSTRNTANVFPVTFGCDRPRAFIIVRMCSLCKSDAISINVCFAIGNGDLFKYTLGTCPFSSASSTRVAPCSATCCSPSLAVSPYCQNLMKTR